MPDSVTREEVQTLVRNGSQLIEVLGAHQYAQAHLAGAINIPLAQHRSQKYRDAQPRKAGDRLFQRFSM